MHISHLPLQHSRCSLGAFELCSCGGGRPTPRHRAHHRTTGARCRAPGCEDVSVDAMGTLEGCGVAANASGTPPNEVRGRLAPAACDFC